MNNFNKFMEHVIEIFLILIFYVGILINYWSFGIFVPFEVCVVIIAIVITILLAGSINHYHHYNNKKLPPYKNK